eukprot:1175358-Prorocentrum_minimum.AAC.1
MAGTVPAQGRERPCVSQRSAKCAAAASSNTPAPPASPPAEVSLAPFKCNPRRTRKKGTRKQGWSTGHKAP